MPRRPDRSKPKGGSVALDKADADAVLTGSTEEKTGVGHAITGRYLGLEDNNTAARRASMALRP